MPSRHRPRRAALAAALSAVVLVTGCSDDEEPGGTAPESASASPSAGGSSPASSTDPEASPTSSSDATIDTPPATGPVIESAAFRMRVPERWTVADPISDFVRVATRPEISGDISIGFIEATEGATVDDYQRASTKNWGYPVGPRNGPRRDVNGVEMYHQTGKAGETRVVEVYGAPHAGLAVEITFLLPTDMPAAERTSLVDSVLASIEWA
ncbi:hypothetical protein AB0N29_02515 [Nocardioides sp. NPDC092400]|uniref:hypothetical protein n=1 Tax=Nocardioides sp. NPDC092400 TaxID=3155196 RepID=UPI00342C90B7